MVASLVTGCSLLAEEARAYFLSSLFITHPISHALQWRSHARGRSARRHGLPARAGMASVPAAVALESDGGKVAFTAGLPLLPLDSSEVVGAGTVLHSQRAATTAVQGVILCLVGLGSTKEK